MSLVLNERQLRLWAAAEALEVGHGGVLAVAQATGLWPKGIIAGKRELAELRVTPPTEPPAEQRILSAVTLFDGAAVTMDEAVAGWTPFAARRGHDGWGGRWLDGFAAGA